MKLKLILRQSSIVLSSLPAILKNDISKLPDLDKVYKIDKMEENILNFLLYNDFLNNHYPKIKEKWSTLKKP